MEHPFPLLFQLFRSRGGSGTSRNENDPVRIVDSFPGALNDGSQFPPHTIPYDSITKSLGSDEAEAEGLGQIFVS